MAVVVAWNRAKLLAGCLDGVAAQTRRPDAVIVVDNASTDDSASVAAAHPVVSQVIRLTRNTGGAGGFATGIAVGVARWDADWVWIMDDDTVPTPTALAELLDAQRRWPRRRRLNVLASRADWIDGREHPMNTPRTRLDATPLQRAAAASLGVRPIRSASFVSILLRAEAVRANGLPKADFFLWNDDFEYTARLLRRGVGLYVPASRVRHLTATFGDAGVDPGPRFYNEVRNKCWLFTRSRALAGWEKPLYGVSTVRRWTGTLLHSQRRGVLLRHGLRGLRDGLLRAPQPTVDVLADALPAEALAAVRELEQAASNARNTTPTPSGSDRRARDANPKNLATRTCAATSSAPGVDGGV